MRESGHERIAVSGFTKAIPRSSSTAISGRRTNRRSTRSIRSLAAGIGRATSNGVMGADGWGVYAWHGLHLKDSDLILKPETITAPRIRDERNAEIRRMLLERFGFDRYLSESGALPIHADETGTLYRCELEDDEPFVMVRVVNSTPEPDGQFKHYALRVDPDLRPMLANGTYGKPQAFTARNAIASTFGLRGEEYQPVQQS